jgi:two-component system, OmpR family, KDP operon response regulator KdpE
VTTILLVEDDPALRRALRTMMRSRDLEVLDVATGEEAIVVASGGSPDLIVLDLGLPDIDGLEVLRRVRAFSTMPVIVLTAHHQQSEKIRALDLGADDYVVKPFSTPELLARIRAQLRRPSKTTAPARLEFPGLVVDFDRRKVVQGDREVRLTPTEFAILELLTRNAGRPVTFDDLIASVWNGAPGTTNDAVRFHVSSLRRKIEPEPAKPRYVLTEPWVGFRFIAEPMNG